MGTKVPSKALQNSAIEHIMSQLSQIHLRTNYFSKVNFNNLLTYKFFLGLSHYNI
jgi:hypothetical protein